MFTKCSFVYPPLGSFWICQLPWYLPNVMVFHVELSNKNQFAEHIPFCFYNHLMSLCFVSFINFHVTKCFQSLLPQRLRKILIRLIWVISQSLFSEDLICNTSYKCLVSMKSLTMVQLCLLTVWLCQKRYGMDWSNWTQVCVPTKLHPFYPS